MHLTINFDEEDNIWTAASDGKLALVQKLVAAGTAVDAQDETGYSVLHAAAAYGHEHVLAWALGQRGVDVLRLVDEDGDTALHVAESPAVAALLLAHQSAAKPESANLLVHARNADGLRAIDVADAEGHHQLVAFLKENYCKDYVPLAEREEQEEQSPVDIDSDLLRHVLAAIDLHPDSNGDGNNDNSLSIDLARLASLVESGQLDAFVHAAQIHHQTSNNDNDNDDEAKDASITE
ncbi:hypothetical protein HK100_011343 [Physocladia obscura]|uniref:Uncharacterized protein n=1 Tax=Physocladia obscura TaxID=109957 RepID=A0AAD5T1I7_9FUNG|nr:hypothetical protein HK100_011343 [Physocladia obscura]